MARHAETVTDKTDPGRVILSKRVGDGEGGKSWFKLGGTKLYVKSYSIQMFLVTIKTSKHLFQFYFYHPAKYTSSKYSPSKVNSLALLYCCMCKLKNLIEHHVKNEVLGLVLHCRPLTLVPGVRGRGVFVSSRSARPMQWVSGKLRSY